MRIYSLQSDEMYFLGVESAGGAMLDLTRAIGFWEVSRFGSAGPVVNAVEQLLWDGRFTAAYLADVLEFASKHNLEDDLTVDDSYSYNPPLLPGKIIALGNNYKKHIEEMNQKLPEKPVLFGKWPSTVIGHTDTIVKPSWIGAMSYEAELAFIVGAPAKHVPKEHAMDIISGYTCLNDLTARDIQRGDLANSLPWMPSKNFDTFCPMGPCILTADEVSEPVEVGVKSTVNGETRQDGNTRDFIFDIPTVIEYITSIMALEPGDVVTTGTPEGVGAIEPGDRVEVTCEGIGTLTNTVVSDEDADT